MLPGPARARDAKVLIVTNVRSRRSGRALRAELDQGRQRREFLHHLFGGFRPCPRALPPGALPPGR